jgi:translation initiation factor IF-1
MTDKNNQGDNVEGVVIETLPEAMFKVMLSDNSTVLAFLSGKMRLRRIRIIIGDRVLMKTDPYGGKARIFRRL